MLLLLEGDSHNMLVDLLAVGPGRQTKILLFENSLLDFEHAGAVCIVGLDSLADKCLALALEFGPGPVLLVDKLEPALLLVEPERHALLRILLAPHDNQLELDFTFGQLLFGG